MKRASSRLRLSPGLLRLLFMAGLMLLAFGGRSWLFPDETGSEPASTQPITESEESSPLPRIEETAAGTASQSAVDKLLTFAKTLEGKPYRAAGDSPAGFDCSGLVYYAFRESLGMILPRSSRGMTAVGELVPVTDAQPGDLVFFLGSDLDNPQIGHVGLIVEVGKDELMMIHTSSSRGVITEDVFALQYYRDRLQGLRRPNYPSGPS